MEFGRRPRTGFSWYNVKINLRNPGAEDLTRLTLLFDFQVPQGSRYATFYITQTSGQRRRVVSST